MFKRHMFRNYLNKNNVSYNAYQNVSYKKLNDSWKVCLKANEQMDG